MKSQTIRYYPNIVAALILPEIFVAPLMIDQDLQDPTRIGKIFFFVRWMLLLIPTGLIAGYLNRKQPVDKLSLFGLAWFIWIALRGKGGGIWHDEKFLWFSGCFIVYFLTSLILKGIIDRGGHRLTLIPLTVICLVAAAEAVPGILQLYGISAIYHSQFKITGTLYRVSGCLTKEVKVPSKAIDKIKEEMQQLVNTKASMQNNSSDDSNNTIYSIFTFSAASEEYNTGDRLKKVNCECPNGDKGSTLRCKSDGDKELCSKTQQGSNACYSTKVLSLGKLLCEGAGIKFD